MKDPERSKPKRKPSGGKVGPPRLDIDEEKLALMARHMCTMEEMAAELGCNRDTLTDNYSALIEKEQARGRASLRRKQFATAMGGSVPMQIFLGKQYLKQRDRWDDASAADADARTTDDLVWRD